MKEVFIVGIVSTLLTLPVLSVAQDKAETGQAIKQEKAPTAQPDRDERKAKKAETKKEDTKRDKYIMKLPNPCNENSPPSWCK